MHPEHTSPPVAKYRRFVLPSCFSRNAAWSRTACSGPLLAKLAVYSLASSSARTAADGGAAHTQPHTSSVSLHVSYSTSDTAMHSYQPWLRKAVANWCTGRKRAKQQA